MIRKIALGFVLTLAGFLIAHAVNGYVSHVLSEIPLSNPMTLTTTASLSASSHIESKELAQAILSSGLFLVPSNASSVDSEEQEAAAPPPPPLELTGKLKLLGTAISDRGRSSAAIEHVSDHKQSLYFQGDAIEGFGAIAAVGREGVTIRQGSREGFLPLEESVSPPVPTAPSLPAPIKSAPPPGMKMIDRRQLQESLSDVAKLFTEARAMPFYNLQDSGKLEGWQLIDIKPKSILDQLGVQQRDVMLRINGTPVVDPSTMLRLLKELQHEKLVKVDLIRDGQRQTLAYEIR
jgi:type II secretion system protein C